MATVHLVPEDLRELYHVQEWRNAAGVLTTACSQEWNDIVAVLRAFRLYRSDVRKAGGNLSAISHRFASAFRGLGWQEKKFETAIVVDDRRVESPTHKIDCCKGSVALEVEWNAKDAFFDRDLNNFRLLFELRAIEVGVIVTRGSELRTLLKPIKAYAKSTTDLDKLTPRLDGGSGGGCPVLVFAISERLFVED